VWPVSGQLHPAQLKKKKLRKKLGRFSSECAIKKKEDGMRTVSAV